METDLAIQTCTRTLAEEYIALVDGMRQGQYSDAAERQILSSQRSVVHDQLIALTGLTDRPAMYAFCRTLLASHFSGNLEHPHG